MWNAYFDDATKLRAVSRMHAAAWAGAPDKEQLQCRAAYTTAGIPWAADVAGEGDLATERLGLWGDGDRGSVGETTERALTTASLGIYLIGAGCIPALWLQVFAGREVHGLSARRPLLSIYANLWTTISGWPLGLGKAIPSSVAREMLCSLALLVAKIRGEELQCKFSGG